jgi:hypothetical protein
MEEKEEKEDLFSETQDRSLLSAFGWWEKKRIIYNLVVGTTGLLCLFFLSLPVHWIQVLFYGIIVNLCFTLGFLTEVGARYYLDSNMDFTEKRKVLFGLGLAFSILATVGLAFLYGSMITPFPNNNII